MVMVDKTRLLDILADGHFHSGERLGEILGISRSAVWKQINGLKLMGLDCYSVSGKGYRLAKPVELLCHSTIVSELDDVATQHLQGLEIHHDIESTNAHLMKKIPQLRSAHACLAEQQSAGRGRRGRTWVSPFGRNIYLSIYWQFQLSPSELSGLALASGVAVVKALRRLGLDDVVLKWPNDIWWQGRKLAGILLEMTGEAAGPYHVVVGAGVNVDMCSVQSEVIDQPWVDLVTALASPVSRNQVAALLMSELLQAFQLYQLRGFQAFHQDWSDMDAFIGADVELHTPLKTIQGIARGIDAGGALLLETSSGVASFHSGEVGLRPVNRFDYAAD